MIDAPEELTGPDTGYVNSLTGQIEKPKNSADILLEIYLKNDFMLKFRSCESQKDELFSKIFTKYCQ